MLRCSESCASSTVSASIDDPPHLDLRLTATGQHGTTTTLASGSEPFELHDEFNRLVHPPSEHWPPLPDNS